jgi:two-component system response regulator AtoC
VEHFLAKYRRLRPEAPLRGISVGALEVLRGHRWPGNVRELEHAVERAVVLADGPEILEEDLPDDVRAPPHRVEPPQPPGDDLSVKRAFRSLEERLIREALDRTGGNRTRAADLLDLSYRALLYKIKEYGIDR